MIRSALRLLMRWPGAHRYVRALYDEEASALRRAHFEAQSTAVGEVLELPIRRAEGPSTSRPRLNLLVPALSVRHVFGGISTALALFEAMADGMDDVRIILTDESRFSSEDNPAYAGWAVCSLDDEDRQGRVVIPAGDRFGRSLVVRDGDRFMATAWWTAVLTKTLMARQTVASGLDPARPFVYLIQDFEPGFYPWSARYALAEATYRDLVDVIPVFNTSLLKQHFLDEGYRADHGHVLEPSLNVGLVHAKARLETGPRQKIVLVYGRPGVERNAFALIVEALRQWSAMPASAGFRFLSVGEQHLDVPLAAERVLESLGKLSLDEYARRMATSAIGISLMVSPHPSYPPLEMAAFGMTVITNTYRKKDLSRYSRRIISVDPLSPASLVSVLDRLAAGDVYRESEDEPSGFYRDYLAGGTSVSALAGAVMVDLDRREPGWRGA